MKTRLTKQHRADQLMSIAWKQAREKGLYRFDMDSVAAEAECSRPLVARYFQSVQGMREAVILVALVANGHKDATNVVNNKYADQGRLMTPQTLLTLAHDDCDTVRHVDIIKQAKTNRDPYVDNPE